MHRGQKRGRMTDYTPSGWSGPGNMTYRTPMKEALGRKLGVGKARKKKK